MNSPILWFVSLLLALGSPTINCVAQERLSPFGPLRVTTAPENSDAFVLATADRAATIFVDADDYPVVRIAAEALAGDINRVAGSPSKVSSQAPRAADAVVLVGTIGSSKLIDGLIRRRLLDVSDIRDQWERFVIATVDNPRPGIAKALVIAGSDRRGAAYGVFSVSESIGVSPWVWWADVTPERRDCLALPTTHFVSKPPSVQYRGIFINDEDFGLLPWAKKNEPEAGTIGPRTYERVCELLLRLKANFLWPAMHEVTVAFNQIPENKAVADRYAIVMGSSHPEPMLFNNASEWEFPKDHWDYDTHPELIQGVWEKRVRENAPYENVYTVGIRGIHDRPVQGGGSLEDGVRRLERVFSDQRAILAEHVNPDVRNVPQIFVPYKEVLPIYRAGLEVPDDVTLVWVDDNFGYIRQLSDPAERSRPGRAGVYYHFSYWGGPEDYLWLGSTSPALTAYEMQKAYAYGADRLWVFNVGDIKPNEKEMEFGLRLAYDIERYPVDEAMTFLVDFATQCFGSAHANEIAELLAEYYSLTAQVKPEHNDRMSLTKSELDARLGSYSDLVERAEAVGNQLLASKQDAYFQLILYPIQGAALMNLKHTAHHRGDVEQAVVAHEEIQLITKRYNREIAGGKWDGMMNANPRNRRVFRRPAEPRDHGRTGTPIQILAPRDARLTGGMKLEHGAIVATAPGTQPKDSGNAATFTFESPTSREVTLYFLVQTPESTHDSWFVRLNGEEIVKNGDTTGNLVDWIKVMDAQVRAGTNTLTISQRESDTAVYQVAVMEPGFSPPPTSLKPVWPTVHLEPEPLVAIAAADCRECANTQSSTWTKVKGLGIERHAMTLLPLQTPPVEDVEDAPSITYAFHCSTPEVTIESRFLPTHHVNKEFGLRYAVSVDDGLPKIINIESPARTSAAWSRNVLVGYARGRTTHVLGAGEEHTITIRLLDPGMVLSQVRVYSGELPRD